MEDVHDVAASFLDQLGPMPAMKLEKLVYYAQAWSAASGHGRLFEDDIEAWSNGPVVERLYQEHRTQHVVSHWPQGSTKRLRGRSLKLISQVAKAYGEFSGDELSALTHLETPWRATRGDRPPYLRSRAPIPVELMAEYYGNQVLDAEHAVRHAFGNAALERVSVPEDLSAVFARVAAGEQSADDIAAQLVASLSRPA